MLKELQTKFTGRGEVKGIIFTQELVSDNGYIYRCEMNDSVYWEVFKRRINKHFNNVTYPNGNAFGKWAWTYQNIEKALEKFEEINQIVYNK